LISRKLRGCFDVQEQTVGSKCLAYISHDHLDDSPQFQDFLHR
jgi:hypothetical protein